MFSKFFILDATIKIKSIQLHDSIVRLSQKIDSIIYITLHYIIDSTIELILIKFETFGPLSQMASHMSTSHHYLMSRF